MEVSTFRRCTRIVCNTREFRDELDARSVVPVSWVPNGTDVEELPEAAGPSPGPLVLAYVGTLYFNRDLGPIVRAMKLCRFAGDVPNGLRLRFAGHADPTHAAELDRQVLESELDDRNIERLGAISRDAALDVLQSAHVCVVLAQRQPRQVPAKLYEAVGLGLQTLVIAEPGSATVHEAERLGVPWKDPSDVAGIASVIRAVATGALPARIDARDAVDYRLIARQYADLMMATIR
jgi:hypothetical protein